jgi:hypothetical protein
MVGPPPAHPQSRSTLHAAAPVGLMYWGYQQGGVQQFSGLPPPAPPGLFHPASANQQPLPPPQGNAVPVSSLPFDYLMQSAAQVKPLL